MAEYRELRCGHAVASNDPSRGVWYSSSCGYWTDDWSKLVGSIPSCPQCRSVGFQTTYADWIESSDKFEKEGHPRYTEWLLEDKEICTRGTSIFISNFIERYRKWLQNAKPIQQVPSDEVQPDDRPNGSGQDLNQID
jgi:hypothetical protein